MNDARENTLANLHNFRYMTPLCDTHQVDHGIGISVQFQTSVSLVNSWKDHYVST